MRSVGRGIVFASQSECVVVFWTPQAGRKDLVTALLAHGADPKAVTVKGEVRGGVLSLPSPTPFPHHPT